MAILREIRDLIDDMYVNDASYNQISRAILKDFPGFDFEDNQVRNRLSYLQHLDKKKSTLNDTNKPKQYHNANVSRIQLANILQLDVHSNTKVNLLKSYLGIR